MKCRYCNRTLPTQLEKRVMHFTKNHPDIMLGFGLRIARDPHEFGRQLGAYVKATVPPAKLAKMITREGIF